jgi:DNA recombination protein RmuC
MDALMTALAGLLGGAGLGAAGMAVVLLTRRSRLQHELAGAEARADADATRAAERAEEVEAARAEAAELRERCTAAEQRAATLEERALTLEKAEQRLKDAFLATGAQALHANSRQFLELAQKTFDGAATRVAGDVEKRQQAIDGMVRPIRELLEKHRVAVDDIEKKRQTAYTSLTEQLRTIADSHGELRSETGKLVNALRRPEQRGRWGEMQLRNVVELAGMSEHCDFREQPQTDDPNTRDRPDMVVDMPGGGVIVVDSKVALDAYLDALQPDADRTDCLRRHGEQVERHYRRLAGKKYWDQFEHTPRLVVMFMPLESALVATLESKPDLHAEAMRHHVLIATPTLLVALLRAVAYGWQQEAVAENAREIAQVGNELYERVGTFVRHIEDVGRTLERTNRSYNSAVGSLEARVLPSTRRLRALHASTLDAVDAPAPVQIEPRPIIAPEVRLPIEALVEDAAAARAAGEPGEATEAKDEATDANEDATPTPDRSGAAP